MTVSQPPRAGQRRHGVSPDASISCTRSGVTTSPFPSPSCASPPPCSRAPRCSVLPVIPLLLQLVVVIAAEQLTTAYKNRAPGSDPHYWARRYTFVSAISGATWGVASLFWFVWDSFPAQAYLCMAYLGMAATEFIARSAHRPAYVAHTVSRAGAPDRHAAVARRRFTRPWPRC